MNDKAETILLVEDALDLVQVISSDFEAQGYRVFAASDGVQAIELFTACHPDLVILDWMLPRLDGLSVLRRLREISPVPVLMLTARSEELDRVLGLEVGADDYLTKPFSMLELAARVRALLRRIERVQQIVDADRQKGSKCISYDTLTLDPEGYLATLNGCQVELSRTEFDLLYLFLQNPGRAFSRSYLADTIWGQVYLPQDRSVDNTVMRLRKKLGPIGEAVETVWGIGYRLRPAK